MNYSNGRISYIDIKRYPIEKLIDHWLQVLVSNMAKILMVSLKFYGLAQDNFILD